MWSSLVLKTLIKLLIYNSEQAWILVVYIVDHSKGCTYCRVRSVKKVDYVMGSEKQECV